MDGRSYTLLIGLVMAGSAMTGCIQNPDWLNTAETEVSAQENARLAHDAALAWSEEAVLVGVMAFELSESPDPRIDADPDPGNGLAPAWWYVYSATTSAPQSRADGHEAHADEGGEAVVMAANSMVRAFKVAADGTVTSEKDAEAFAAGMDHDGAEALGAWSVDSDDALTAAKTDASFAKVAQGFNATVVEGIAHHDGRTSWWVSAMSVDGFVIATVDATTGELLDVSSVAMDFEIPTFQWGAANPELEGAPVWIEAEGSSSAGDEPVETHFGTTSPVHGTLTLDYSFAQPGDGLHVAILDGEGELVFVEHIGAWGPEEAGSSELDIELEDAGKYTLSLGYMGSLGFIDLVALPTGGSVDYAFVLDLMPGEAEHDEDEDSA